MIESTQFILYVSNQQKSCDFYKKTLGLEPVLNVEGMTEFELCAGTKLGLMPEKGIAKILGSKLPDPSSGNGVPRCELYLLVDDPDLYLKRSINAGAVEVSPLQKRAWGDTAGYVADPDGHVIAFAKSV